MSTSETEAARAAQEELRRSAARTDDEREPDDLERDIDVTRAQVRADLEALERRLSFDRLVDLTVGRVRERGGAFAGNLTDAATRNPIPLLLTSVGVAWMMLTTRQGNGRAPHSSTSSLRSTMREGAESMRARASSAADTMGSAKERLGESWQHASETSRETWDRTAESLREGASRAREQVDHARERLDRLVHEQPMVLGALGLAAGALIGALLPATEAEDRVIGEARSKAFDNLAQASRQRYEAAREHAATYSAPEQTTEERPSRPH